MQMIDLFWYGVLFISIVGLWVVRHYWLLANAPLEDLYDPESTTPPSKKRVDGWYVLIKDDIEEEDYNWEHNCTGEPVKVYVASTYPKATVESVKEHLDKVKKEKCCG